MYALQRLDRIREILLEQQKVDVQTLSQQLNVSDVTIRKDLEILRQEGFIIKTHGGALLAKNQMARQNLNIDLKTDNLAIKKMIAGKAYEQIRTGDSIFIGSGVTCYLLAHMIRDQDRLSVVTNNISAVQHLQSMSENVRLIGGEITCHENLLFTSSEKVEDYFKNLYVNKAFTSATAIDLQGGITVTRELSTFIFKEIKNITKNWYLMAESMKYDRVAMYRVARFLEPDVFITDEMPAEYEKRLTENNKKIILV